MEMVSREPMNVVCPNCRQNVMTQVAKKHGLYMKGLVLLLCGLGLLCLGLIPLCMKNASDSVHFCANCGAYIGTYEAGCGK